MHSSEYSVGIFWGRVQDLKEREPWERVYILREYSGEKGSMGTGIRDTGLKLPIGFSYS